jgi:hypothetical protein
MPDSTVLFCVIFQLHLRMTVHRPMRPAPRPCVGQRLSARVCPGRATMTKGIGQYSEVRHATSWRLKNQECVGHVITRLLLFPYLAWLCVAAALNFSVLRSHHGADHQLS